MVKYSELYYPCDGLNELDSWLEDFEKLDFDYSGALPNARPLVFQGKMNNSRVLLLEDQLLECEFNYKVVDIKRCPCLNRPPSLVTAKTLVEMLKASFYITLHVSNRQFPGSESQKQEFQHLLRDIP